jgi:hypothetical protein
MINRVHLDPPGLVHDSERYVRTQVSETIAKVAEALLYKNGELSYCT